MDKNIQTSNSKTSHVGNFLIYGFIAGMLVGLVIFNNVALGAGFGMCIGIVVGALTDLKEKRSSERVNPPLE